MSKKTLYDFFVEEIEPSLNEIEFTSQSNALYEETLKEYKKIMLNAEIKKLLISMSTNKVEELLVKGSSTTNTVINNEPSDRTMTKFDNQSVHKRIHSKNISKLSLPKKSSVEFGTAA